MCVIKQDREAAKRGKLLTFFKTYIGCDGRKLIHTPHIGEALEIFLCENITAFKLPGKDRYIRSINGFGVVELSEQMEFFKIKNTNNKISVGINDQFLSPKNDPEHSFHCVSHCKEVEFFDFISL